ncbi:MAG: hypothetical protein HZY79_09880 [Rhodoblastus sp.]|nr:MAG: hypothetical protein HZY79_09880 [Rhodoblastus sp.]
MSAVPWSDTGLWPFVLLTFILGGATAWATGRAVAGTWRPIKQVFVYTVVVAAAVRFLSYALFDGDFFLSLANPIGGLARWALAYVILSVFAAMAYRVRRDAQMARQYSWLAASSP